MKRTILTLLVALLCLFLCQAKVSNAAQMGTAWTYQGRLLDANSVADGLYDFEFRVYDDPNVVYGNQVGSDVNVPDMDVIDGYFTVEMDFNDALVFNGEARWLEISVRPGDSNNPKDFVILSPRQEITSAPYALYAKSADWGNLHNIPLGFADGIDDIGSGDITSVIAGLGLNGGGSFGDVILNVDVPLELVSSDINHVLNVTNTATKGRGILGHSSGAAGYGVKGLASHTTGVSAGVIGESKGDSGSGVYGYASATGAVTNTGGYFEADGDTGRGVYSEAWGAEATGVYGYASASSGTNYGIYGKTDSNEGYAGYFEGKVKVTDDLIVNANVGIGTGNPGAKLEVTSSGVPAAAIGAGPTSASGIHAVAIGADADANSNYSIAMGTGTKTDGWYSTAIGTDITVSGRRSVGIGVGISDANITSDNVMAIMGGNVGIGITNPTEKLEVDGTVKAAAFVGDGSGLINVAVDTDWVEAGGNVYRQTGNVGIGISTPEAKLDVRGTMNIGVDGAGHDVTLFGSESGSRMSWDESKMALRAGIANGSQWDDMNVGKYSTAMGNSTTASGEYSTAMGAETTASGGTSTAMGIRTDASGLFSTAMGYETDANGINSTAMGYITTASGTYSTAMGAETTASGGTSTAMGIRTDASGLFSTAMGYETDANGLASTTIGYSTTASGEYSTAMGAETTASGGTSTAMGIRTDASGLFSTAMGYETDANGLASTAMGYRTIASGKNSIAMGTFVTAGPADHTIAIGMGESYDNNLVNNIADSLMVGFGSTTPTLFVDGSSVGIGTTSPDLKLSVSEGMNIDQYNSNDGTIEYGLRFGRGWSGEGIASKRTPGGNQYGIDFYTGNANRMCITDGGNVGIGTTSPKRTLHIKNILHLETYSVDIEPPNPSDGDICIMGPVGDRHILCYLNGGWRRLDN